MATSPQSRYATPGTTDTRVSGTSSGTGSVSGTSSQSSNTSGTSTTQNNQTTQNLDPASQALLQKLVDSLLKQGTQDTATKNAEIAATQTQQQQQYSKDAAFKDSQGLVNETLRRALESSLPNIRAAMENAGSSGGALSALLTQDAAQKAAESGSAVGVQAATNYGNVSANFAQVLAKLLADSTGSSQAAINALNVLKGAVSTTTGTQTTSSSQNTQTSGSSQQNTTQDNKQQQTTDYAPFSSGGNGGGSTAPIYYGPQSKGDGSDLSAALLNAISTNRAYSELFI
jgi:hypothetical protein